MKCYYHNDVDAVGVCKSCGKGLCKDCLVDLGKGLACKGHCEEDVQGLISTIENNIRLSPTTTQLVSASRTNSLYRSLFILVAGAVFFTWGLMTRSLDFAVVLGAVFIIYGLISIVRVLRTPSVVDKKETT